MATVIKFKEPSKLKKVFPKWGKRILVVSLGLLAIITGFILYINTRADLGKPPEFQEIQDESRSKGYVDEPTLIRPGQALTSKEE